MSVLDKILTVMRLNPDDDEDFYNEDFDYDEDYEEEKPVKQKSSFRKKDRTEEQTDIVDEAPAKERALPKPVQKVTPIRQSKRGSNNGRQVCVIKPTSVEDAREITETLLGDRTVVLNVEGLNVEIAQRIIDFTSGSCFAINGNLQKISNYIFIITPSSVDISGDFLNLVDTLPSGLQTDF
jgi:cell division inhibitor SepF